MASNIPAIYHRSKSKDFMAYWDIFGFKILIKKLPWESSGHTMPMRNTGLPIVNLAELWQMLSGLLLTPSSITY